MLWLMTTICQHLLFTCSPSSWRAYGLYEDAELLHYRIVNFDRPGFGYSNFGNDDFAGSGRYTSCF
jgi:hypothetical protein